MIQMTPDQVAPGKALAEAWKPKAASASGEETKDQTTPK